MTRAARGAGESTARFSTRPDIAYARIADLPDNQVGLSWESTRRSPLITEFAELAG